MIAVLKPTFDDATKKAIIDVLDSGWVGAGPVVLQFEKEFAEKVGVRHAIAVNSGTAALDLCLKAYGITGGELITTPMTFVADASVGLWNGMRVSFADIHEDTLCLDPASIILHDDTKAIIAVDSHGRLANIADIRSRLLNPDADPGQGRPLLIEDAAHAFFTPGAGQQGDIAIWSFQAVKTCPAGDGGMITTNDDRIAKIIRSKTWLGVERNTFARTQGKGYSWEYDIVQDGLKAYMNDINAVLALGNMRRIDELLTKRRRIQTEYNDAFKDLPGVELPAYSDTVQYYTIKTKHRDAIASTLAARGIATSVHFKPLHLMTYWAHAKRQPLPVTDRVWLELLSLPCHDALTLVEQEHVTACFQEAVIEEHKKGIAS